MKEIKLTQGKVALVDDKDYEFLSQWNWYAKWQYKSYYAARSIKTDGGKTIYMHRQIMNSPQKIGIDHKNHDSLDNRRENLRLATPYQNHLNTRKQPNTSSIFKGVYLNNGRWTARIGDGGKYYLGSFKQEHHAAMAYDIAAKDLFGEFACLNFPMAIHG